ncbi:hypothetical protein LXA43DRAFT_1061422 [Ganoderma leucocontextum]|nr:hypothetical protein LXA43DRAFT_1061422 [Ganoderma leucocontextum]
MLSTVTGAALMLGNLTCCLLQLGLVLLVDNIVSLTMEGCSRRLARLATCLVQQNVYLRPSLPSHGTPAEQSSTTSTQASTSPLASKHLFTVDWANLWEAQGECNENKEFVIPLNCNTQGIVQVDVAQSANNLGVADFNQGLPTVELSTFRQPGVVFGILERCIGPSSPGPFAFSHCNPRIQRALGYDASRHRAAWGGSRCPLVWSRRGAPSALGRRIYSDPCDGHRCARPPNLPRPTTRTLAHSSIQLLTVRALNPPSRRPRLAGPDRPELRCGVQNRRNRESDVADKPTRPRRNIDTGGDGAWHQNLCCDEARVEGRAEGVGRCCSPLHGGQVGVGEQHVRRT